MKQNKRKAIVVEHQEYSFNYLKESGFFSIRRYPQGKTRTPLSKHEYSDKGLFANELNHAYFFYVSECNS